MATLRHSMGPDTWSARAVAPTRREVALLLAVGIGLRIVWLIAVRAWSDPVDLGEATNASLAFARQGVIADSYFHGQGPTAHMLPTMIVIAGTLERLLGPESPAANIALGLWALLQVSVGFVLTAALFRRLSAERPAMLAGLGVLCLVPACIAQEVADFRVWEAGLAYDFAVANLLWMVVLFERVTITTRNLAVAAAAAACAFFVSPPAGLAVCAGWGLFALKRLPLRRLLTFALLGVAAMTVLIAPWAIRNKVQLGEPVLLRSNFGLELAIANHAGALDPADPRKALTARMNAVHQTEARFRQVGGEVAWSRRVGAATWRWIAANPGDFVRLTLRHYRQFYLPDTWEEASTNWGGAERVRIRVLQLVGALGLFGLIAGLRRRRSGYAVVAVYIAVAGLPYALVQPIPRYSYITYPLLAFLAAQSIVDAIAACRAALGRNAVAGPPGAAQAR